MEKARVIVQMIKILYVKVLRNELKKLVEQSDSPVDDMIIGVLDKLLLESEK